MDDPDQATRPVLTPETPPLELRGDDLRRNLRRVTLAWVFGSIWATAVVGTPLANYATCLKASRFEIGVLSAIPFVASLLSLPASLLIEATGKRRRIFLWGLYFQRFMWFPIALLPIVMVHWYGEAAAGPGMVMFLSLIFLMHIGQAVGGPAWVSWMADIVPDRVRGKYFARRRQWGIASALPTALVVGWLLDRYAGPAAALSLRMMYWCAGVFLVAALFGILDIAIFHWITDIPKPPQKGRQLLAAWREPLKNRQFLWFGGFVATIVFAVSFMGQFVTFYVMEQMGGRSAHTNTVTQLMLIVAPSLAMLVVFPVWGHAADRLGKRPLLILAALGLVPVGLGWCFLSRELVWLGYILSAAGGALWAGIEVANLNLVLEFSGSADEENNNAQGGSSYVAVNGVIINIAGCLGGVASGVIAQSLRDWQWTTALKTFTYYDVLFALSAVLRLGAVVVFLPHIHEHGSARTREALRFMTANIYNNLFSAVLQPLRNLLVGRRESYEPGRRE